MKIGVIGTGYVGLVSGTCFAEMGNEVTCIDIDEKKVSYMQAGKVPIFEPGLAELFHRNIKENRLFFSTTLSDVLDAAVIFLALPTPPSEDGSADLSSIVGVAKELSTMLKDYTVIVDKSTVPVGTAELVRTKIAEKSKVKFDVVSNPEFLREGQAVRDFMNPDRIVIGTHSERAREIMAELYRPLVRQRPERLIVTDAASAEMIKYASNGFLATKITFMNELAALCHVTGADIEMVRMGIGTDSRIGSQFLYPGPGYGGSCFPKDTLALHSTAKDYGIHLRIIDATIKANEHQKHVIPQKIFSYYKGRLKGKTFALWGLAFKDNTDDIRESPALVMIDELTKAGAKVVAFDPQAIKNVKKLMGSNPLLSFVDNEYDALLDADALIIATNWKEFFTPDYGRMQKLLKSPIVFDSRNLYDLGIMEKMGFYYESIGRRTVDVRKTTKTKR